MSWKKSLCTLALLLSACKPVDQSLPATGKDDPNLNKKTDVTNQSSCSGPTPLGQNIFKHPWQSDYKLVDGSVEKHYLIVEQNAVSQTVVCNFGMTQVSVTARANASVTGSSIQIFSQESQSQKVKVDGVERTCESTLNAGQMIRYAFQGPCLSIAIGSEQHTLIPADSTLQ